MGLDITAYRKVSPAPEANLDSDGYPKDADCVLVHQASLEFTEENWPGRSGGLKPGVYSVTDEYDFRAGSYGGYNAWRNWLATVAGYANAEAAWNSGQTEGPFYELIHFADNEGVIGAAASAKLAKDFADHQTKAEQLSPDGYYIQKYNDWRKAFEMAADDGFVNFH